MKKHVLAIGAHPDDIEFGCFGTLQRHINDGDDVTLLVMSYSDVTDAHTGNVTRDSDISKQEALEAANILGVEVILGPFIDTQILFNSKTIKFIENIIKERGINWVYTHWAGDTHQDHINTLNATMSAARLVKNVLCYEQVPLPRITTTYPVATYYVDITDTINTKIVGCKCHSSQINKFTDHGFNILDNVKTLARYRGNQCGVKYAEAFNILKMVKE